MFYRNAVILTLFFLAVSVPLFGAYTVLEAEHASLTELKIIAGMMGLDIDAGEDALRRSIMNRLDEIAPAEVPSLESSQEIIVRSADRVVSVSDKERRLVTFSGNVELYIEGDPPIHLKAELVMLDHTSRMLFVFGDVKADLEYLVPADWVSADAVMFSLDDRSFAALGSTAVFSQEGEQFFLSGKRLIIRDSENITIERGVLSTREEDPYFSIRSSRIQLLPSGDISLTGATLYLGRVPLFYFPYFYYPARTFIFNPVVGYDSARGYFSQNTLYLSGAPEPEKDDDPSIFQFFLDQAAREGGMVSDVFSLTYKGGEAQSAAGYQRILADVYSGIDAAPAEVFLGYELFEPRYKRLEQISLKGGLSFGKQRHSLDYDLPYTNFGGFFDVRFRYSHDSLRAAFQAPYATEREFTRDFMNRFEHFSLQHLFDSETEWPVSYRVQQSLEWKANLSYRKSFPSGSLVELFNLRDFSAALTWRLADKDGKRYFTPNILTAPNVSYRITGNIISLESKERTVESETVKTAPLGPYAREAAGPYDALPEAPEAVNTMELRPDRAIALAPAPGRYVPDTFRMNYIWDHDASLSFPLADDNTLDLSRFSSRLNHTLSSRALLLQKKLDISSSLRTRVYYYDRPFGETQGTDLSSSYINQLHDLKVILPSAGLTYRMDVELYYDRFLFPDDADRNTRVISWSEEQFRNHDISYDYTFRFPKSGASLASRISLRLPPLDVSLAPRLTYTRNRVTLQGETRYTFEDSRGITESSALLRYRYDERNLFSQTLAVDHEQSTWKAESRLLLAAAGVRTEQRFLFGNEYPYSDIGPYTFTADYRTASLRVVQDWLDADTYSTAQVRFRIARDLPDLTFWKNRVRFSSGIAAELQIDNQQDFSDSLVLSLTFGFRIEEFISLTFSSRSYNRNPGKYLEDPLSIFTDIADSLNFSDIDARRISPFKIETYRMEAVHYMPDWNFHASLNGTVELAEGSWDLVHRLHVYLQWKHIPELRFDERSEFN